MTAPVIIPRAEPADEEAILLDQEPTALIAVRTAAAFGSSRPQKWSNRQLLENHPRIRVGGLRGHSEVTLAYGGKAQIVQIEEEWTFGRRQRLRPWFRTMIVKGT